MPLQMVEVAARNAIILPVQKRFGAEWFGNAKFHKLLPLRMRDELSRALTPERHRTSDAPTHDQVLGGLSLGFFQHLTGASYDKHLWANGIANSFPFAPETVDRASIHLMLDEIRLLRNEVMHHVAIFDQRPNARFQTAMRLISYISADTHWLVMHLSNVSRSINERPRV